MSDTEEESATEDEGTFDREAEKEKLREQLAREEENRRSTQHMSELLLKGATMTNKHCDICGDPLFRHQGQEFCPTCSREGAAQGRERGQGGGQERGQGNQQPAASAAGSGSPEVTAGSGPQEGAAPQSPEGGEGAAARGSAGVDRVDTGTTGGTPEAETPGDGPTPSPAASGPARATGVAGDVGGDVAGARAALARKLSSLARQAEATEDVGRSRELLAAAREAAEALAAIDRIGR